MLGVSKKFGTLEPRPLKMLCISDSQETLLLHLCHLTKYRRSRSKHLGVAKGSHFLARWSPAPWDRGVADP